MAFGVQPVDGLIHIFDTTICVVVPYMSNTPHSVCEWSTHISTTSGFSFFLHITSPGTNNNTNRQVLFPGNASRAPHNPTARLKYILFYEARRRRQNSFARMRHTRHSHCHYYTVDYREPFWIRVIKIIA